MPQLKFKKASADEVRAKRNDHVKDASSGSAMIKGFKAPPSWNKDSRSAKFIMSSETVDRYRDIVVQNGIDTKAFEANPQGLLFHNSRNWPIGMWSDIKKVLSGRPKRTEGVLNFLPEGTDDDADRAARHVEAGSLRTVSIGFIPDWDDVDFILDEDDDWTGGFRFNKCELIECSLVPVPAQPDALVKDAGGDWKLARDLIEDVLDNYAKTPEGLLIPLGEYEEKYFEIGGQRASVVIDKALAPSPKTFVPTDDFHIKAATDEEAAKFVGIAVTADPGHPENKQWPFNGPLAKETGEIIGSWIVDEGEFKGVHALAVEFLSDEYSGMFRGIKAERFLIATAKDVPDDDVEDILDEEKETPQVIDELADLSDEVAKSFIERGMVFLIELKVDDKTYDGTLIAKSHEDAEKIVEKRGLGEKVLGEKVLMDDETDTKDLKKTLSFELDISNLDETHKKVENLESTVDRVIGKIAGLFGGKSRQPEETEKLEPELSIEPEDKAPPSDDQVQAVKKRASAVTERLISKGLIAAE